MSPYQSQVSDTTRDNMEVPQAVIAQAEAAASSNQPPDGQRHSQSASDQTPEALGSKENHPRSSTNGQKYAYLRSYLATSLVLRLLDSRAKQ